MEKDKLKNESFYNPFEAMAFTYDKCFLCGTKLKNDGSSIEHVFPKWLQNRFDLWDQKLTLLNGTKISYRQLTIPCCKLCNSNHLADLENMVHSYLDKGYSDFYI